MDEVETFCSLGSVLDREVGVEGAVRARVAAAWAKWREIAGLLCNRWIPLKSRGNISDACIRSVILYGAESWPLTQRLEKCIHSCDRRLLRNMSGVSLRDKVSSTEVAQRCGLEDLLEVKRVRRLQWFGHVNRREEGEALSRIHKWHVEGRRPRGRTKRKRKLEVNEDLTTDRCVLREAINRLTP